MSYLTVGNGKLETSSYVRKGRSYVQIYAIGKRHIGGNNVADDVQIVNMTSHQAFKLYHDLREIFGGKNA
jgi:hypothetical protein